jgi:hypothetical protein
MDEIRNSHKILVGNPEAKTPLGRPRPKWIKLKWILEQGERVCTGLNLNGSVVGSCEHANANKPSVFIKVGNFFYQFLKNDSGHGCFCSR